MDLPPIEVVCHWCGRKAGACVCVSWAFLILGALLGVGGVALGMFLCEHVTITWK